MREICTSGLMRGSHGIGDSRPLLSTLLMKKDNYDCEHRSLHSQHEHETHTQQPFVCCAVVLMIRFIKAQYLSVDCGHDDLALRTDHTVKDGQIVDGHGNDGLAGALVKDLEQ